MLQRKYPTQPIAPGQPEKREHEYIRHGVRALIASFVVATGHVVWNLADAHQHRFCRPSGQCGPPTARYEPLRLGGGQPPYPLEPRRLPPGRAVVRRAVRCQGTAPRGPAAGVLSDPMHKHVCHLTPKHGSWLNQVEWWFRFRPSLSQARRFCSGRYFDTRLSEYLEGYHTPHAHPYRWTYTGQPLVRATPFSQTRRQQRQGRAWGSTRPKRIARALYPPRPYRRVAA